MIKKAAKDFRCFRFAFCHQLSGCPSVSHIPVAKWGGGDDNLGGLFVVRSESKLDIASFKYELSLEILSLLCLAQCRDELQRFC